MTISIIVAMRIVAMRLYPFELRLCSLDLAPNRNEPVWDYQSKKIVAFRLSDKTSIFAST